MSTAADRAGVVATRAAHKRISRAAAFVETAGENLPGVYMFQLPLRLMSEANLRGNWRKHRDRHATHRRLGAVYMRLCELDRAAIKTVMIARLAPRMLDSDNAVGSAKSLRDGIADWIGRGDGHDCGIEWIVVQEKSPAYGVRVVVRSGKVAAVLPRGRG